MSVAPCSGQIPDFVPDCDAEDNSPLTVCDRSYTRPADPGWGTGLISIAHHVWSVYGDYRILQEFYPNMQAYIVNTTNLLDATTQLLTFGDFGDWNPPNYTRVDIVIVSSQWLYKDLLMMVDIANALNYTADASKVRDFCVCVPCSRHL
jgi:hypothetical protein